MTSKRQLKQEITRLKQERSEQDKRVQFWKSYAIFLKERVDGLEGVQGKNAILERSLGLAVADLNNLRWKSGFVHTACLYDTQIDRKYCARCKENNYKNWKWRGDYK